MTNKSSIPLAIIGMACKLPGADDLDQFWQLLIEGRDAVVELPPDRLDRDLYYDPKVGVQGKSYSTLGAIISSRQFNRAKCPIPEALEHGVDNAHLLMCEVAADAVRNAGMDPFNLPLRNTGVYIGHAQGSDLGGAYTYATYAREAAEMLREVDEFKALPAAEQDRIIAEFVDCIRGPLPRTDQDTPDLSCSLVAGTISKAFQLTGPYLSLNSACASSLQAMLVAARALQLGRIDMAIVGGASDCKGDTLVLFANARAMSSRGSRPFDADADGLVVGEGYASIVLKTLDRALADGDRIHAVLRGLGVSSDGKGKSLWAPRKEGQVLAMQRAYRDGLDMGELDYVEAHATATQLGDATELNTLAEALSDKLPAGKKVPITSVKANLGHTLETAGMSGVIKTILAMQHQTIPPAANVQSLNPKIDWQHVPVFVPREAVPWPPHADGRPRRAGVNAFGIGGLNMHVVIEEFNDASRKLVQPGATATPLSKDEEAIAVIGMGCVLPGALGVPQYWDLLASGRDAKSNVTPDRWRADLAYVPGSRQAFQSPTTLGGFITDFRYDWKLHKIPPKQLAQADPLQFMLLDAADQALKQSGYDQRPFDRTRVGTIVGTECGGDFAFQLQMGLRLPELERHIEALLSNHGQSAGVIKQVQQKFSKTLLKHWPALIDETGSFSTSSLASRTAKTWNLMGGAATIDSGHASALAGLAVSIDMLLTGDCDMMLCAAGQRRLGLPEYEALSVRGVLPADGTPVSPLDERSKGYIPGEGVGVVLLKRLSDAKRDNDPILAVIRGVGAAHHPVAPEALQMAIERSLGVAGAAPQDIDLMEVDGSLSVEGSQRALQLLAGMQPGRERPLLVSSVSGQIGHLESAAGLASLIKANLEMARGVVPRAVGLEQPVSTDPKSVAVVRDQTPLAGGDDPTLAAVISRSRGLTYHVIVEGVKQPAEKPAATAPTQKPVAAPAQTKTTTKAVVAANGPAPAAPVAATQPIATSAPLTSRPMPASVAPSASANAAVSDDWRVVRFAANSAEQLIARLSAAQSTTDAAFKNGPAGFHAADRYRVAIAADSPDTLATRLAAAVKQGSNPASHAILRQQGIFFAQRPEQRPTVLFCFPGQGSQYKGMLQRLVEELPAAAAALGKVDRILERYGYPSFAELAWGESKSLGVNVWLTQLSMLIADWVFYQSLDSLGIAAHAMLGHSFGEFGALTAAGALDFETTLRLTRARCDGIAAAGVDGTLLATSLAADEVAKLAISSGIDVHLANFNAPDQTVVGGTREMLTRLQTALKSRNATAQLLAVPAPFHTPLMASAAGPLKRALEDAVVNSPRTPLWSVVTNRPVADAEEVRRNLVSHLTSPVRYVDLVREVTSAGPCVLVEVGPGQVLTNLHRRILEGRDVPCVASDQPKRPGVEQLYRVKAMLEAAAALDVQTASTAPTAGVRREVPAELRHPLLTFDATARRRNKMREAASGKGKPGAASPARPTVAPAQPVKSAAPAVAPGPAALAPPTPAPAPPAAPKEAVKAAPKPAAPAPAIASPAPSSTTGIDLERFLINFVVEQTGYPPEVVEIDADLEGDLGIDSIKKAQLFGELQEYFDVVPTEDLSLDNFPTLRHVLEFLRNVPIKGDLNNALSTPMTAAEPAQELVDATSSTDADADEAAHDQVAATGAAAAAPATSAAAAIDLERFLINFVVEQTGYPPEVVELDADLEGDLGIDSIKKAQLFGELQEYFDVVPTEDLSLDNFPTLRHVLDFLRNVPIKGDLNNALSTPMSLDTPASDPSTTASPEPYAEAPTEATTFSAETTPDAAPATGGTDLEQFLINFVVEQTGYPPEVVELDADLEGDLGIDSIKKAQLFGELQEYFDVVPTEDLSLDNFPTLRHVLDFLRHVPIKGDLNQALSNPIVPAVPAAPSPAVEAPAVKPLSATAPVTTEEPIAEPAHQSNGATHASPGHDAPHHSPAIVTAVAAAEASHAGLIELAGTPYEMGLKHGQILRDVIRRSLRLYVDLAGYACQELPLGELSAEDARGVFTDEELDEMLGIADGAEVPLDSIVAHNLAVLADLGGANLQFLSRGDHGEGPVHLGAWSLPLMAALRPALEPVIIARRPTFGLPHAVVTLAGTVGCLAGINAEGLTISGAPRRTAKTVSHARRWPTIVSQTLEKASGLESALDLLESDNSPVSLTIGHASSASYCHVLRDGGEITTRHESQAVLVTDPDGQVTASLPILRAAEERLRELVHSARGGEPPHRHQLHAALQGAQLHAAKSDDGKLVDPPAEIVSVLIDAGQGGIWLQSLPSTNGGSPTEPLRLNGALSRRGHALRHGSHSTKPSAKDNANEDVSAPHPEARPEPKAASARPIDPEFAGEAASFSTLRFTMHMSPQPFPAEVPANPEWQGPVLIVGDNPAADALERAIAAQGVAVHRLRATQDVDQALATVDQLCSAGALPHLFLTSNRDEHSLDPAKPDDFERRYHEQVMVPFYIAQRWIGQAIEGNWIDRATIVALTSLGGNFGFDGQVEQPEGGALTGIIKAACLELHIMRKYKGLLAKAVDAPADEPASSLAANVLRELAWRKVDYEIAFRHGVRQAQGSVPRSLKRRCDASQEPAGAWVVTGGARGITAFCALELGQQFGLKLHLIGSSPKPNVPAEWRGLDEAATKELKARIMAEAHQAGQKPADVWETANKAIEIDQSLEAFRQAGIEFVYHSCDVSDRNALAKVLDEVRRLHGPIQGIMHGAGVERSGRFERKARSLIDATMNVKILGAYHLMDLTKNDPVRHFVGFGSTSGRLGSTGQVDYCAANDMLAKLLSWYRGRRPDCRAVTIHWHAWDEVGMAYRPETRVTFKMTNAPMRMPKREGARHLIRELTSDVADTEALITTAEYFERFYGKGSSVEDAAAAPATATMPGSQPSEPAAEAAPKSEPLAASEANVAVEFPEAQVADRKILRPRPAPIHAASQAVSLAGPAFILGDNADARELTRGLAKAGIAVQTLPLTENREEFLEQLDELWSITPARELFLLTGRDVDAMLLDSAESCQDRHERGIVLPYLVVQRWLKQLDKMPGDTQAHLVAVTNLGGDFGIRSTELAPECGALAGLLKAVHVEGTRRTTKAHCKVIDFSAAETADRVAELVLAELAADSPDIEVAYPDGHRHVIDVVSGPVDGAKWTTIPRGSTWVVTGGARGITAAAAMHLGRRYGLKLHLIGASPVPQDDAPWRNASEEELKQIKQRIVRESGAAGRSPEDEWRRIKKDREIATTLEQMRAAGIQVTYHACDVSDWQAVAATLEQVRALDGPITGVIHGAGYFLPGRLEMKSTKLLERTVAPKFSGTLALMSLTRNDPLRYFVTFGSISGRYGGNGMADYAAANDAAAKLSAWYRGIRPECHTACLEWQTWDETGMVTLGDIVGVNRNSHKMQFIPVREGVTHLERELCLGLPIPEVVITDGVFAQMIQEWNAASGNRSAHTATEKPAENAPALPPMISSVTSDSPPNSLVAEIRLDPQADPFMTDHRLRESPFLPGVAAMETLAEAAALAGKGRQVVALQNVQLVQGIKCKDNRPAVAHVRVEPDGDAWKAALSVEIRNRNGDLVDPARACCTCRVELADAPQRLEARHPGKPALGWFPWSYPEPGVAVMHHGPKMRALTHINYQYDGGFGQIVAPSVAELAGPRSAEGWIIPMAVLDAAIVACGGFVVLQFDGRLEIPHSLDELRLGRAPRTEETCVMRLYFRGKTDKHSTFDFTVFGENHDVLLDVRGYRGVLVAERVG